MLLEPSELLARLPIRVIDYQAVASPFADATHCVYRLVADEGVFALKLLRDTPTPFWRGMDALFDVRLAQQVTRSTDHYARAADTFSLRVPGLIDYANASPTLPAYLLTSWLAGDSIDPTSVSDQLIEDMAHADALRHQKKLMTWGRAVAPFCSMQEWQARIATLLPNVSRDALMSLSQPDGFVPMIMDMRWDQCLQQQGRLSALVDMDAFVYAPKTLELVLMEYWLTSAELSIWRQTYLDCGGELPTLRDVRSLYRQLLWSWQIFGPIPEPEWMQWPIFFD